MQFEFLTRVLNTVRISNVECTLCGDKQSQILTALVKISRCNVQKTNSQIKYSSVLGIGDDSVDAHSIVFALLFQSASISLRYMRSV